MPSETLGVVDCSSGTLILADFGLLPALGDSEDAIRTSLQSAPEDGAEITLPGFQAVRIRGVPKGRYEVRGERFADGEWESLRQRVQVEIRPGAAVARTVPLGHVIVDTARLGVFDPSVLPLWNDQHPSDGKADVALWGRDEDEVARRFVAQRLDDGTLGFADMPYDRALDLARELHALREAGELRFAFDFRPHTDPYFLLAQIRRTESESGVLELGDHACTGFLTTWGDGTFPVELDLDADGAPIALRVGFEPQDDTGESDWPV